MQKVIGSVKNDNKEELKKELGRLIKGLRKDVEETKLKIEQLYYVRRVAEIDLLIVELDDLLKDQQQSLESAIIRYIEIA